MQVKKSIIELLLNRIKGRPGMYLGRNHISLLATFITGYQIALVEQGFDIETDPFFGKEGEGFLLWYGKKTGVDKTPSWYYTMLTHANNSEEEALELFFVNLEEFAKEKNVL